MKQTNDGNSVGLGFRVITKITFSLQAGTEIRAPDQDLYISEHEMSDCIYSLPVLSGVTEAKG